MKKDLIILRKMRNNIAEKLKSVFRLLLIIAAVFCIIIMCSAGSLAVTEDQYDFSEGTLHLISGDFTKSFFLNFEHRHETTSIVADSGVCFVGDFAVTFYDYTSCVSMDFSKVDTTRVTQMQNMFPGGSTLVHLDVR